jgi:BolA protein
MSADLKIITIKNLIEKYFPGCKLYLNDESSMHAVPAGNLTHLNIILVSDFFLGQSRVRRHQYLYNILNDNLEFKLHATAMHLYTTHEWLTKQSKNFTSPQCTKTSKNS